MSTSLRLIACLALGLPAALPGAEAVKGGSALPAAGVSGAGGSFAPIFSADGRWVAFVSHANNLVTNDDLGMCLDVFARNLQTRQTALVSVGAGGLGSADAVDPSFSADGRFVSFASAAGNLVPADTNRACDVFVRDLVSGITALESVDRHGGIPRASHPGSRHPLLSADGRWVFFESTATNLTAEADGLETLDVFARDRVAGVTHLVSVTREGTGGLVFGISARLCAITPDGRHAAFVSAHTNLAGGLAASAGDLHVRDLQAGTTRWASSNLAALTGLAQGSCRVLSVALSADGQVVLYKAAPLASGSTNRAFVCRQDLLSGAAQLLGSESRADSLPQLSADGRWAAFESNTVVLLHDVLAGTNLVLSADADGAALPGVSRRPVLTPDGQTAAFLNGDEANRVCQVYVKDFKTGRATAVLDATGAAGPVSPLFTPALSADGARVVFESASDAWVTNDLNLASDVFVAETSSGATELVSERAPGRPAWAGGAASRVWGNCLSADGRWLAFASYDGLLAPGDTNRWTDAFVRDLWHGTNLMISRATNMVESPVLSHDGNRVVWTYLWPYYIIGSASRSRLEWHDLLTGTTLTAGDWSSDQRSLLGLDFLSPDGRWVALLSRDWPQYSGYYNVVAQDMETGLLRLISTNRSPASSSVFATADCRYPAFTPDGQWVLFRTTATNVATNFVFSTNEALYACHLAGDFTRLLSRIGPEPLGVNGPISISGDSRLVAFASMQLTESNSVQGIYIHDLQTETTTLAASNATAPSLSKDGRWVAWQSGASGSASPPPSQVFVTDRVHGTNELISVSRAGVSGGNGPSTAPLLSGDGRYVVFTSAADDLVEGDANRLPDLFVRDRAANRTFALSASRLGGTSRGGVSSPVVLSADGRTVAFNSFAGDLAEGDYNDTRDVYVARLGAPDSDGDGLDDDWEIAYFNTLARDGTGDFDADGAADRQEFGAGTDPTNQGSVLRVLVIGDVARGRVTLLWPAVAGRAYQPQFKEGLADPSWTDLPGAVQVTDSVGSTVDEAVAGLGQRYYRILVKP